jgi:glutamate synthase (NADPH) small chain
VQPVRRALLPVALPAAQQHPRLAALTAEGRLQEAYELSQATNTFPEICGRICPQDRLCEGNCVIEQSGHGTVTIGAVEKYITDTAWEEGWVKPIRPHAERPESVGIIGAGRAGLRRRTCCGGRACRSRSMTAMTARAG